MTTFVVVEGDGWGSSGGTPSGDAQCEFGESGKVRPRALTNSVAGPHPVTSAPQPPHRSAALQADRGMHLACGPGAGAACLPLACARVGQRNDWS